MSIITRKIGQTVWPEIAGPVVFFTLCALAVTLGCELSGYAMKVNTVSMHPCVMVSSEVVALLLRQAILFRCPASPLLRTAAYSDVCAGRSS